MLPGLFRQRTFSVRYTKKPYVSDRSLAAPATVVPLVLVTNSADPERVRCARAVPVAPGWALALGEVPAQGELLVLWDSVVWRVQS